jgi:hypothetical protein
MHKSEKVLVVFGEDLPKSKLSLRNFDTVVAKEKWRSSVEESGLKFMPLETLIDSGSIYDATELVRSLTRLTLPDGTSLPKSFLYEGYELWWFRYNSLYLQSCLPYTQYKRLLAFLKDFRSVSFHNLTYQSLFFSYLKAHDCEVSAPGGKGFSLGVIVQAGLTLIFLPLLILMRRELLVFTGDKFEKSRDHDFRMRYIYEELRAKKIPFVEFIRSLESWRSVFSHALTRKRPVVYSEALALIGRCLAFLTKGFYSDIQKFESSRFKHLEPETRFRFVLATQYLRRAHADVWSIRIMKFLLRMLGVKAVYITTVMERNFQAFVAAKSLGLPVVGILHGVASPYYNGYDFLPDFAGEKRPTVDKYGVWSNWWKELYLKHGKSYRPEQLLVSGPMRPLMGNAQSINLLHERGKKIKVLFISEQLAFPDEVPPFLTALLADPLIEVCLKVRAYRDGFENWLIANHPEILGKMQILRGTMQESLAACDLAVGSHSTAVLEALLELKPAIFYDTKKWGDYFELKGYHPMHQFFAETPSELVECVTKNQKVPIAVLKELQERFFGDPYQNGSKWVVEELEKHLGRKRTR